MSQISKYFEQSELALAAYAHLDVPLAQLAGALRDAGMSKAQANSFLSKWDVITHYNDIPAEGGLDTGFSATVFKDSDGQLALAIRGKEGEGDFYPTDADIFSGGSGSEIRCQRTSRPR